MFFREIFSTIEDGLIYLFIIDIYICSNGVWDGRVINCRLFYLVEYIKLVIYRILF